MLPRLLLTTLILFSFSLFAGEVVVDLNAPEYIDGVLYTDKGGVITTKQIRIQAQNIRYAHNDKDEETIVAECKVQVLYGRKILVGKRLEYNLTTKCGLIDEGFVAEDPWFVGGKRIRLLSNGSYAIDEGFITLIDTSENDFSINARKVRIEKNNCITANDVGVKAFSVPLFTFPSLKANLGSVSEIPIQVKYTGGGIEGSYITLRYNLLNQGDFKVFLRADYVLGHGPGGGFDTTWITPSENRSFVTKNFAVRDRSYDDPDNFFRYRFEGAYDECFCGDKMRAHLVYDFLSDTEMASDFSAKEFDLNTGERTEFLLTRKEDDWIADLSARVRVNDFQSINQELPYITTSARPITLGNSGIISDTKVELGYLNYVYAEGTPSTDFHSSRIEANQMFYRPIHFGDVASITPEVGFVAIHYGNNPFGDAVMQGIGRAEVSANTYFHRTFNNYKHILEPYVDFQYYTAPKVPFSNYYIFDIEDGYAPLQIMRVGIVNSLFARHASCCVPKRPLFVDIWANVFFNEHTFEKHIPRIYLSMELNPVSFLQINYDTAWNRETNALDYYNLRHLWTLNEDIALSIDFLSRGPRAWRKANPYNFMLDAQQPEELLLESILSDKRNTLLSHLFYRFHPNWRFDGQVRYGWNRGENSFGNKEPNYLEYQIDLATVVGSNWNITFSYEHREIDNRFSVGLKLGKTCPPKNAFQNPIW